MTNDDLKQKYDSLVREYCRLMDKNQKLQGKQNAKQTSEYNSLVREYCKLQEENKKLKEKFSELQEENKILEESLYDWQEENINENFTHLNGRGYLKMNETKDDLKIQVKVILIFTVLCISGMIGGAYIFDATSYTATGIIIFCFFLWSFVGCARVAKKIQKQLQDKE